METHRVSISQVSNGAPYCLYLCVRENMLGVNYLAAVWPCCRVCSVVGGGQGERLVCEGLHKCNYTNLCVCKCVCVHKDGEVTNLPSGCRGDV